MVDGTLAPGSQPAVAFRLVGVPKFSVASSDWQELSIGGASTLLSYTALQPTPPSRADVARMLWRGDGGKSLRQALYQLQEAVSKSAGRRVDLLVEHGALALARNVEIDLHNGFEAAAQRLELGELLQTVNILRLPEEGRAWLKAQRERWHGVRARAYADAASQLAARGQYPEAIALLRLAFDVDSARHDLAAQLAQMLSQVGAPEEGLAVIAGFRAALQAASKNSSHTDEATQLPLLALERRLVGERDAPRSGPATLPSDADSTLFSSRESLLTDLQHDWETGQVFLLVGESGIGKTRLMQQMQERSPCAMLVRAEPGDADIAYETSRRWLRECLSRHGVDAAEIPELCRLLPELGQAPRAPTTEFQLARMQITLLSMAKGHGLSAVLVDDLHFADSASLRVLKRCIEALPGLAFGLSTRTITDGERDVALRQLAADGRIRTVTVPRLSAVEARSFIGRFDGEFRLKGRELEVLLISEGVPWKFIDLVRRFVERGQPTPALAQLDQPTRVDLLMSRLSPPARAILNIVAVAGPICKEVLAAGRLALPGEAIERSIAELNAARLMEGQSLAHDIVAEQVLARLDKASLRGLHAMVADALSHDASPERRAYHCAGAERWRAAADHACDAAHHAERLGERHRQCEWLMKAETWYRRASRPVEAFRAGVESLEPCLYCHGSVAAMAEADRLAGLATHVEEASSVEVQRARIAVATYEFDAALGHAALADVDGASTETRCLATAVISLVDAFQGRLADSMAKIEAAIHSLEGDAHASLRWEIWSAYGIALSMDERWQAIATQWPALLKEARRQQDKVFELDVMNSLACANAGLGHAALSIDMQCTVIELRAGLDDNPESQRVAQLNLAATLIAVGRYSESISTLQALLIVAESSETDSAAYRYSIEDVLAEAWLALGQPGLATEQLAGATAELHAGRRLSRAVLRARAASDMGSHTALDLWHEALEMAAQPDIAPVRRERTRLMAIGPHLPLEAGLCEPALALAREREHRVLEMMALLRQAQCRLRRGFAEQPANLERMMELARTMQSIYLHRPEVLLTVAEALACGGHATQARQWMEEGRAWVLRVAEAHVEPAYRESFLGRPIHRRLLSGD